MAQESTVGQRRRAGGPRIGCGLPSGYASVYRSRAAVGCGENGDGGRRMLADWWAVGALSHPWVSCAV
jgi:hypothetical protein